MSPITDSNFLGLAAISDDMASGTKLVEMIKTIFAMKDKIIAEKNKEIEIKNNNIFSLSQQLNTIKFYKNYKDQEDESSDKNTTLKDHEIAEKDIGAKYLFFFSSRSLKMREKYISFAQFVYFLREVCLLFNF